MSQRGGHQNFFSKYAPLRLKGVNNPSNNSAISPSGNPIPYSPRASRFHANSSVDNSVMTGIETNNSEPCDLNSSLDNIAKLCQRQERRNREIQVQLESVTTEMGRLKAQLDVAAGEIELLHNINGKLRDSHQQLEKELNEVDHLYADVKTAVEDTAQILDDARKDKDTWLFNFEKLLKKHYEKREMQLRREFQQAIEEKEVKLDAMRCDAEQLVIQYHDTAKLRAEIASSREQIKQLNSVNEAKETELNALRDKLMSIQEAVATYEDVKHSLDILTKERAALQERYNVLDKQSNLTSNALVDCTNYRNELEISVNELNKKLEDESKKTSHSMSETQELIQQLTTCQHMLEEKTTKMEDLSNQLSILNERNKDLDRKTREIEDILTDQENSRQFIADLEKQVAELKFLLSEKTIELQCKEKRIEETETALTQQVHSLDQLAISEESNRELQRKLDEKSQELEAILVCRENSERLKADLDKEIAELKCQLMAKSIELQYKGERMEEMEKALHEMSQKSLNTEREKSAESCRLEVDTPRQKEKKEIESLKTSLNLKNLELESISGEYEEAQKIIASAERKIGDLELTVSLLERRLETEREQASFSSQQPIIKAPMGPPSLRPILKQSFSDIKQDIGETAKSAIETFNLLQKANAIAKAAELKRRDSGGNHVSSMIKPPSPSSLSKPLEKRRRLDNPDGIHTSSIKVTLHECADADFPVLCNNSSVLTSRFLPRSHSISNVTSVESPAAEAQDVDADASI